MEETAVYQRVSGMKYLVQNPSRETKGNLVILKPAMVFEFNPRSPRDNRAEFDPMRYAEEYVKSEMSAGLIDVLNEDAQEKRIQEVYKFACKWIENHADFGPFINRKPGREQIREQLANQRAVLEQQIAILDEQIVSPEPIVPEPEPEPIKEEEPLMVGGGVIAGGATMRTARGRPRKEV